jgi:beta-lactam-binding protein with PASTA domain
MKMLTVLFGAAAGVAATISVGAGIAAAVPDVVGQTYNDAKQAIQGSGSAVVIATRTGGLAETDKCLVTNAWDKPSVTLPRQAPPLDTVGSR